MDEVVKDKNAPGEKKETLTPLKNLIKQIYKTTRILYVIDATLFPLLLLSTIYCVVTLNQLSNRVAEISYDMGAIEVRTAGLENKQAVFHAKLTHLDEKLTALSDSPILKEVEALAPRVNLLEKQLASIHVRQKITHVDTKPVQTNRQYYVVKEGDTLFRISLKCGISVEELARMNNLHDEKLILAGQRLRVSK